MRSPYPRRRRASKFFFRSEACVKIRKAEDCARSTCTLLVFLVLVFLVLVLVLVLVLFVVLVNTQGAEKATAETHKDVVVKAKPQAYSVWCRIEICKQCSYVQ